jgi:tail tube protein
MKSVLASLQAFLAAVFYPLFVLLTRYMHRQGLILGIDFYFPEGSKFYYSNTFAAVKDVTIASNANPALLTAVGHGYSDADVALFRSGWEAADGNVYKLDQQSVDTVLALDLDSSDTDFYGAGTGVGTLSKITGWVEVPGILTLDASGGDVRYTDVPLLARRNDIRIPTGFTAVDIAGTMVWDPADATYIAMRGISRTLSPVAFKMVTSGGAVEYAYGNLMVSSTPRRTRGQVNQVALALAVFNQLTAYTS